MRPSIAAPGVAALVLVLGCASSSSDANGPIAPTRSIAVPPNTDALTGYGNTFALEFTDVSNNGSFAGFRATLQLYRWDAAYPKDLLDLGTVYLGVDTLYQRLSDIALSADRATVTLNFNDAPSGWVAVVDTSGPTPSSAVTVPLSFTIDRAVASGRWLLAAAANALTLVDLESPGFPVVKTFDMGTTATLLLAVSDGFLVFTNAGYGHVTPDAAAA
ncbi:MAG TPA: hypothetical protein VFK90_14775, partial [Anaeromyxobacter sp.]|nr:hypothetical protein [Anaeromyxobacter sp.]